jgi:hypothetical protein
MNKGVSMKPKEVVLTSVRMPRELARAFDLSVFPCAECGKPSVAEHYDFESDRLLKLCKRHKDAAIRRDLA